MEFRLGENMDLLFEMVNKTSWPRNFPPVTVNAMYTYSRNQLIFPIGILKEFSKVQLSELQFGQLGFLISHEVSNLLKIGAALHLCSSQF